MKKLMLALLGLFVVWALLAIPDECSETKVVMTGDDSGFFRAAGEVPALELAALNTAQKVDLYESDIGRYDTDNYELYVMRTVAFEGFKPYSYRKEDPGNQVMDVVVLCNELIANRPNSPPIVLTVTG